MAPSNDAGEISAAIPMPSAPPAPDPDSPDLEPEMDDCRHSSASSSPPTHPAFFMASPVVAHAGGAGAATSGKENVCPSPMAAAFSPLGSPLAMHLGGKRAPQRPAANAGAVLNKFIDDCTSRSSRGVSQKNSPIDIDTNDTAAQPAHDMAPAADSNASKKSKRKSKKTNGVNEKSKVNAEDRPSSQPASYAEAVKEGPADVANGGHREATEKSNGQSPDQEASTERAVIEDFGGDASGPEAKGTEEKNGNKKDAQPTAAGSLTFAEAVKEPPTDTTTTNGQATEHGDAKSRSIEKGSTREQDSASAHSSQGSTAVDYPDIHSDAEDHIKEVERLQDQEKPPGVAGLRWAPIRVPFRRRLQTLSVLFHCLCMGTMLSIFFGFCAIPLLWPLRKSLIFQSFDRCGIAFSPPPQS